MLTTRKGTSLTHLYSAAPPRRENQREHKSPPAAGRDGWPGRAKAEAVSVFLSLSPCGVYSSRVQRIGSVGMTVCHPFVFRPARERAWTSVSRIRVTDVMIA